VGGSGVAGPGEFGGAGGGGGWYGGAGGAATSAPFGSEEGPGSGGGGSGFGPENVSFQTGAHEGNGLATITYTTVAPADLSVANGASPNPVASGNRLTYTITVTNGGEKTANQVKVQDQLPETVVFGSMSTTQGTCTRTTSNVPKTKGGLVTCNLDSLDGGKTATITILVTPTTKGTLKDTAVVSASNVSADADDSFTAITKVLGD
jgi:uncharacterized repeat protein (TIGR01451 family)